MKTLSRFQLNHDLGRYLGVPVLHPRITKRTYWSIVDKVQQRLANWKVNQLSMAGRITLCNAAISALPVYTKQSTKLPRVVADMVEKLSRAFIWGDTESSKHPCLLNWLDICQPKDRGGLGVKILVTWNRVCLLKLIWKLAYGERGLWRDILLYKYFDNVQGRSMPRRMLPKSYLARNICSLWISFGMVFVGLLVMAAQLDFGGIGAWLPLP